VLLNISYYSLVAMNLNQKDNKDLVDEGKIGYYFDNEIL